MGRLLPILLLSACGYSTDRYTSHQVDAPGGFPSVAVLPFDNNTFRRGLEIELTKRLDDELRSREGRTPAAADRAEWTLTGSIVRAEERVLSGDINDRIRESSFVVTARFVLKERATEKILGTHSITESEPFSDRAGRIATLEQAEIQALRDLAEGIVNWIESRHPKASTS